MSNTINTAECMPSVEIKSNICHVQVKQFNDVIIIHLRLHVMLGMCFTVEIKYYFFKPKLNLKVFYFQNNHGTYSVIIF